MAEKLIGGWGKEAQKKDVRGKFFLDRITQLRKKMK